MIRVVKFLLPNRKIYDNESFSHYLGQRAKTVPVRRASQIGGAALWLCVAAAAVADEPTVALTIRDHQFEPAEVQVPADIKMKLVVKNADATPEEFESVELRREKLVAGGKEIIIYVGPLAAGTYEFIGDFHPRTARGHLVTK